MFCIYSLLSLLASLIAYVCLQDHVEESLDACPAFSASVNLESPQCPSTGSENCFWVCHVPEQGMASVPDHQSSFT